MKFRLVASRNFIPERAYWRALFDRSVRVTPASYIAWMETMHANPGYESPIEHPIDEYVRLCREVTMLEARAAVVLGEIERNLLHEDAEYLTAAAFVRDRLGVSAGEARRRVAESRGLADHHLVRDAYEQADIDRPRVAMLLAASKVGPQLFGRDEAVLVDAASSLSMGDARRAVDYWRQAADAEAAAVGEDHLYQRRALNVSQTFEGMVRIDGNLDPESGKVVLQAIRALVEPTLLDADDERSLPQRRADALVEVCAGHLAHGVARTSGGTRPHVTLTVAPEALRGEPAEPCELDETVVTPATARRIACDAAVTEIVTDGNTVLDAGRTRRTVPGAIRKALEFRDGGCVHPGCNAPPGWCDAHHIIHWADGGPTALDNLELRCRRHHRRAHEFSDYPARE